MKAVLVSDVDFDEFCLDHFPDVKRRFASGMERGQKENLLIEQTSCAQILEKLREHKPKEVARDEHLLTFEVAPGEGQALHFTALGPDALTTVRAELAALLAHAFSQDDLRRFLASGPEGADVIGALPKHPEGKKQFVAEVVEILFRYNLVNTEFFTRLLNERAYRATDIGLLQARWSGIMTPAAGNLPVAEPRSEAKPAAAVRAVAPASAADEAPAAPLSWRRISARTAVGAALRLDRSTQWAKVLEACQRQRHAFFLLYGQSRQSLGLFLDRIHHYLTEESGRPHGVYRIPFRREHFFASSGAEWETHISYTLAPGQPGTAATHIATAAQRQSLLLILGLRPLHRLTPEQENGLREFICENLPRMLESSLPANPVRTLIAVDFDEKADSLEPKIDRWALEVERRGVLDYCALSEVKFPTWEEVESYLRELRPRPTPEIISRIKDEFDDIISTEYTTFQQLAERLDRHLLMDV